MIEPDSLPATRDAYDAVATLYAQQFADTLRDRSLERALLAAFAESVRAGGEGEVAGRGMSPLTCGGWGYAPSASMPRRR